MTSDRAIRANRRNAQARTGLHTAAGKSRSGQNARKHGLLAADPDPHADAEIERLAVLIAGKHGVDFAVAEAARALAEAHSLYKHTRHLGRAPAVKVESRTIEAVMLPNGSAARMHAPAPRSSPTLDPLRTHFSQHSHALRRLIPQMGDAAIHEMDTDFIRR
ncbi:hypothetical protein [Methylobacterium nigriterrae]|uniref:hypothetical protein n=1 Tax=Methylobacterium nigriterrae TaxID=3127512 RepID=UPI003013F0AA